MKKLFLAICFSVFWCPPSQAKVKQLFDHSEIPQVQAPVPDKVETPKVVSFEGLKNFLEKRFKVTVQTTTDKLSTAMTDIEGSDEMPAAAPKGTYQKIYDDAMRRSAEQTTEKSAQKPQFLLPLSDQPAATESLNLPIVETALPPDGRRVLVPASEHIPYFMSNIELHPDGTVIFADTVVAVENGQKLREGLSRFLPRRIFTRDGGRQSVDYTLIRVTVNNDEVPYHIVEIPEGLLIAPSQEQPSEPGIYTYVFEYMADNLITDYGDYQEFYWDITGSAWNLVVARIGATLSLPDTIQPLDQHIFIGSAENLHESGTVVINPSPQIWGYASEESLAAGEGMHLLVTLPPHSVLPPSWDTRLLQNFADWGDLYISLTTLAAIIISFLLSWNYIRANKGQLKIRLKKSPVMLRYLLFGRYDFRSFGSFLLELYRKNIIDIQQADSAVLLIKRTDNLKSLNFAEQKAVNYLFTQNEPVLNVNKNNRLKIVRAALTIEKDLRRSLFKFLLKLNSGYLFFSLGMLFLGELFIAFISGNWITRFLTLFCATFVSGFGIFVFNRPARSAFVRTILKIIGIALFLLAIVAMAAEVSLWSALALQASLLAISRYTAAYAQRRGLLKSYIDNAAALRTRLPEQRETILIGHEIANQQAYIWAFKLEDAFAGAADNEYNKLPAIAELMKILA